MRSIKIFVLLSLLAAPIIVKAQEDSFIIPEGSQYSILPNNDNVGNVICLHPDGGVWIASGNTLQCNNKTIELPSRIKPSSLCGTNANNLVLFSNDTIFLLDNSQTLRPLVIVEVRDIIIQPFGKSKFAFCAVGDTVIYSYDIETDHMQAVVRYTQPIRDFIVDQEDIYLAAENNVVAFLKEKQYVPIFHNTNPIISIAFCGDKAMLFSDKEGLWVIDRNRNKYAISNQPILDIVTDSKALGFFKTTNGDWLVVSQILNYSK